MAAISGPSAFATPASSLSPANRILLFLKLHPEGGLDFGRGGGCLPTLSSEQPFCFPETRPPRPEVVCWGVVVLRRPPRAPPSDHPPSTLSPCKNERNSHKKSYQIRPNEIELTIGLDIRPKIHRRSLQSPFNIFLSTPFISSLRTTPPLRRVRMRRRRWSSPGCAGTPRCPHLAAASPLRCDDPSAATIVCFPPKCIHPDLDVSIFIQTFMALIWFRLMDGFALRGCV